MQTSAYTFRIDLPKMVKEIVVTDEKNGNILWQDAIEEEMENLKIAFQFLTNSEKAPNGYKYVDYNVVFDIKMEDLYENACIMVEGHLNHILDVIWYSSVV